MKNGNLRSNLLGIVGLYLCYLAYQLYQGRNDPDTTMTPTAMWLFMIFFVVVGIALVVYALILWKRSRDGEDEETPPEDENSLK